MLIVIIRRVFHITLFILSTHAKISFPDQETLILMSHSNEFTTLHCYVLREGNHKSSKANYKSRRRQNQLSCYTNASMPSITNYAQTLMVQQIKNYLRKVTQYNRVTNLCALDHPNDIEIAILFDEEHLHIPLVLEHRVAPKLLNYGELSSWYKSTWLQSNLDWLTEKRDLQVSHGNENRPEVIVTDQKDDFIDYSSLNFHMYTSANQECLDREYQQETATSSHDFLQPPMSVITSVVFLCYVQHFLQEILYSCSPKRANRNVTELQPWTHHKMVKPDQTSHLAKFLNIILKNLPALLTFICIVSSIYSCKKSFSPLYNFVEKKMVNASSSYSPYNTYPDLSCLNSYHNNLSSKSQSSRKHNPLESPIFKDLTSHRHLRPHNTDIQVFAVAKYAETQNPILSQSLQQQLDAMSPKEYLPFVLNELTLDERESLLVDEGQRRKTFLANWPLEKNLSGIKMAQSGFYALNDYDRVQCVFCRGSLHKWDSDDIPMNEHQKLFPFCRFVKGMECGNREYRSKKLTKDDTKNITKYGKPSGSSKDGSLDNMSLGISTNRAATIQHAPDANRLKTYTRWPTSSPVNAKDLCDAGFYYTGFDDNVRCFFCSGALREWGDSDVPWEEHARWFPECLYLIHKKGEDYINMIHKNTPSHKKCERKTQQQKHIEAKKKETITMQEEMHRICIQLGYEKEEIAKAIALHSKPYEKIGELIDALHRLQDNGNEQMETDSVDKVAVVSAVCPDEDKERSYVEAEQVQRAKFDGEFGHRFELGCWTCEAKTNSFNPATHIGMPCGHLIYCDKCNTEQERKSRDEQYTVVCPYKNCGTKLSAGMRVYFA